MTPESRQAILPARSKTRAITRAGLMALAALPPAGMLFAAGVVVAQASTIRVGDLDCAASPEVVTVTNQGSETLAMTGWVLQSDPPEHESFDLGSIGALSPNETVFIESGPGASGAFIWSAEEVLRDGDSSDYVRVVDANGAVVAEAKCPGTQPAATGGAVPDGGGPPLPANAALTPMLVAGLGASLALAGLGAVTLAAVLGLLQRESATVGSIRMDLTRHQSRDLAPRTAPISPRGYLAIAGLALAAAALLAVIPRPRTR